MTFTDRGKLLLDVGSVQDGRVTLSQRGLSMCLLPETLSGIHRAWQDGDIPLDGKDDWECSTFSPDVSDADRVGCVCSSKDQLLISAREATDLEQVGVGDGRFGQGECWGGD